MRDATEEEISVLIRFGVMTEAEASRVRRRIRLEEEASRLIEWLETAGGRLAWTIP